LEIGNSECGNPYSAFRNSRGFSYIALLVAIVIIGISLGAAGKYWQNVMLRDKEEEMLFRGNQYRRAIERYYSAIPGRLQYPQNIDDLLMDTRTPTGKRHLRQKYKDPMTGEDFVEIRDARTNGIIGVQSKSDKEPLKKDNFPPAYQDLAGKTKYSEWLFVANTSTANQPIPSQPRVPGQQPVAGNPNRMTP
jgi:type II secretory pathway pseudopilin PulG